MSSSDSSRGGSAGGGGIGLGTVLALLLSYLKGNAVFWIIAHALLGWLYVFYLCLGCGGGLPPLPDAAAPAEGPYVEEAP